MRFHELIEDVPTSSPLYHGTDVMSAARILLADEIKAVTDHHKLLKKNGERINGVSLTRSFRFAVDWRGGCGVVFELNSSKLRMKSKIIPIDYYQDRREMEEFVVGPIKNLSDLLIAIYISPESRDYCIEHDEEMIEGHKDYDQLLSHPLLKVITFPKQVPYVNPRKIV